MEKFKRIPGYSKTYKVSTIGRVKRTYKNTEQILKQNIGNGGYKQLTLISDKGRVNVRVHQLMAIAFLNHKPCGMELVVNHINGDKIDNRIENLEVTTQRLNCHNRRNKKGNLVGANLVEGGRWMSQIRNNKKRIYLGLFDTEQEAHDEYINKLKTITNGDKISLEKKS